MLITNIGMMKYKDNIVHVEFGSMRRYESFLEIVSRGSCAANTKKLLPLSAIKLDLSFLVGVMCFVKYRKVATPRHIPILCII